MFLEITGSSVSLRRECNVNRGLWNDAPLTGCVVVPESFYKHSTPDGVDEEMSILEHAASRPLVVALIVLLIQNVILTPN